MEMAYFYFLFQRVSSRDDYPANFLTESPMAQHKLRRSRYRGVNCPPGAVRG
jgi:hypothetical protein